MTDDVASDLPRAVEEFEAGAGVVLPPSAPYEPTARTRVWRIVLATAGIGGIVYGAARILQSPAAVQPLDLFWWLLAALIVHDGILAPVVSIFGFLMARLIPGRGRAYVQGGLIAGALVTTFTLVEIYREGKSRPGNSLLEQDYGRHLLIVFGVVLVLTVALYVARVVRDRRVTPTSS